MSRPIRELRNLGAACETALNAVGIFSLDDLKAHGVEGAFIKLVNWKRKNDRRATCYNALFLYALYGAIHDLDWREIPEEKKQEFKAFAAEVRAANRA